jgi:hypothetical protein
MHDANKVICNINLKKFADIGHFRRYWQIRRYWQFNYFSLKSMFRFLRRFRQIRQYNIFAHIGHFWRLCKIWQYWAKFNKKTIFNNFRNNEVISFKLLKYCIRTKETLGDRFTLSLKPKLCKQNFEPPLVKIKIN